MFNSLKAELVQTLLAITDVQVQLTQEISSEHFQ